MNRQSPFSRPAVAPIQVNVIRIAMFSGPLVFGIVTWYLVRSQGPFGSEGNLTPIAYAFVPLAILAAAGTAFLRRRQEGAADFRQRFTFGLIGWALCESTSLFGSVYFLLTGNPTLYLIGLALLAFSLFYLSPKRGMVGE